jgi:transporter family-2 protein
MNQTLYLFLDMMTGMVISVMVVSNTLLGQATTMGVSLIINHLIGLTILSFILFLGRKSRAINGPGRKVP